MQSQGQTSRRAQGLRFIMFYQMFYHGLSTKPGTTLGFSGPWKLQLLHLSDLILIEPNIEISKSRDPEIRSIQIPKNHEISEIDRNRIETNSDLQITQLPTHCPTSKPAELCQALQRLRFSDRGTNEKTLQCLANLSQEDFTFSADKS
jgi:hypothetical protein